MCYSQCPFQQGYTGECNNPTECSKDPKAWCFESHLGENKGEQKEVS